MPTSRPASRRLARPWSHSDLSRLKLLERNTKGMLEKAAKSMRLPFLEEDLTALSIPMRSPSFSECKKKSRSTAMLDVAGYSLELDDEKGEELPTDEAIERLQRLAAVADPKAALGLSGVIGELQAGVCQVCFYADGALGRFVTLHALRLLREDGQVLMQVGRWRPRTAFVAMVGFPGSKRPSAKDFNSYIDFLIRELAGVLGGQKVQKTGTAADVFKEASAQFGAMTTYRRMLQHAKLLPGGRRSLKLDSVQQLHQLGPSCVIRGVVLPCSVTVVSRSPMEAEVYAWLPAALVDSLDDSKEVKNELKHWVLRFASQICGWAERL